MHAQPTILSAHVSPAGDGVASFVHRGDGDELVYCRGDGRSERVLSDEFDARRSSLAWSHSGSHVYVASSDCLVEFSVSDGSRRVVDQIGGDLTLVDVHPDGDRLLCLASEGEATTLVEYDAFRGEVTELVPVGTTHDAGGGYSPSGAYVAYNATGTGGGTNRAHIAPEGVEDVSMHREIPISDGATALKWNENRDVLYVEDHVRSEWYLYTPETLTFDRHEYDAGLERVLGIRSDGSIVSFNTRRGFVENTGERRVIGHPGDSSGEFVRPVDGLLGDALPFVRRGRDGHERLVAFSDGSVELLLDPQSL